MNIILFTHPEFLSSQSMPRFAGMIVKSMRERGYPVEVWTAQPFAYRLPLPTKLRKWLSYIDQFLIFPIQVRRRLKSKPSNTVYVFADQALGPWVPLVANRPHVIHVHDFMALRSSLGEFHQNPVSWTGRIYQQMIRRGFGQGQRFISASAKTATDLQRFLPAQPQESIVVHHGLNYPFRPMPHDVAQATALQFGQKLPNTGFLLHVGGNQWYKNRSGVLAIYNAYIQCVKSPLPLLMMGEKPTQKLLDQTAEISGKGEVRFIVGAPTEVICAAYSTASALIFPSIAEGLGWPIVEAMTCGCPVLTTDDAPMTEVGGDVAIYLPRMNDAQSIEKWANKSAEVLLAVLMRDNSKKERCREAGLAYAQQFNPEKVLDVYEAAYQSALKEYLLLN